MLLTKHTLRLLAVVPLLFLAACGEGWEADSYTKVPYTMERTAGTGVAYVRAKLMPARGPAVEAPSFEEKEVAPVVAVPPTEMKADLNNELYMEVQDADEIFEKAQRK